MTNEKIAKTFEQVADLLEFKSANPFRVRAYRKGARILRELSDSIANLIDADRDLTEIEGIGSDLADKCRTLVQTGQLPMLNELLEDVPASVLDLMRVPGLGPKKAAAVFHELGISNLTELRTACESGKIRDLKGFARKTEQAILDGLRIAEQAAHRLLWAEADKVASQLRDHLAACDAINRMEFAGSYRRGRDTVGDLDILVVAEDTEAVMNCFAEYPEIASVIGRGETKMSVRLDDGFQVDLRVVRDEAFGAALQYFTGSKDHNVVVRRRARQRGLKVNEYGVFDSQSDQLVAGRDELDVYETLGLLWIPPELREARSEFEWAETGRMPTLVTLDDIKGDLHMHTHATDGRASIEEMASAARNRGLQYIAITDHSQRVSMAHGLDAKRVLQQWSEIDRLNQQTEDGFRIYKGIECDILEKGGMDLPDDVLAQADWVLASIHYGQNQSREQITDRILGAIEHPHVDAIAHPTGRLLNRREAYDVDMDAVFAAAKQHNKVLELNANPRRLDLNDVHCAAAKRHGIKIVINTDAHSTEGLDVMKYGVQQARRGGLTADDLFQIEA